MNEQDFIFGCRSGLQKAIRRGDLNLARTCFETLWADKAHRQWLQWRTPVLVAEEAWFLAGELGEFQNSQPKEDQASWRRFIYNLTLSLKSKEAHGLWDCATVGLSKRIEGQLDRQLTWEYRQMREAVERGKVSPNHIIRDIFDNANEYVGFSPYENAGLQRLISRALSGGMLSDKWLMISSIILTASRRMPKPKVIKCINYGVKRWKKHNSGKPRMVNLPWYVFDMHTQIGKIAMSIFMKRKAASLGIARKEDLDDIWFYLESAFVPKHLMLEVSTVDQEKVGFHQSIWWPLAVEAMLGKIRGFKGREELLKLWNRSLKKEMLGIVGWLQEKRDS